MKKALFIVGPTSVGKTLLAYKISQNIPSVLISADSIQVYKGLDIISGKDHDKSIKIFLIDVVSPFENFSVGNYVLRVKPIVSVALRNNKIPIIVGGTGFYSDALFSQIDTIGVPRDLKLRQEVANLSVNKLQEKLKKTDPLRFSRMNESDVQNKRRLIRAIEVSGSRTSNNKPLFDKNEILIIGLKTSRKNLKDRISKRVKTRLEMGAIREAKMLFKDYKNLSPQVKSASGYKQMFEYLLADIDFNTAVKKWVFAENQLAKKQMTWFRRNKNIIWFDIEKQGFEKDIMRLIEQNFTSF